MRIALLMLCLLGLLSPWFSSALSVSTQLNNPSLVWLVDLIAQWQWLYVVSLVLVVLALARRHWVYLSLLSLAVLPFFSASPALPQQEPLPNGQTLSIASVNVHYLNSDTHALRAWLDKMQPDLVVLLELSPRFAKQIAEWQDYPTQHLAPATDPFGIGLMTKLPLQSAQTKHEGNAPDYIEAQLLYQQQALNVIAFHPMPPIDSFYHQQRNQSLQQLSQQLAAQAHPALIIGDFNATAWSNAFQGLAQQGWYRSTTLQPTWPSQARGWFGIGIDHVLAYGAWRKLNSAVGPAIGSDHLPVWVQLQLTNP